MRVIGPLRGPKPADLGTLWRLRRGRELFRTFYFSGRQRVPRSGGFWAPDEPGLIFSDFSGRPGPGLDSCGYGNLFYCSFVFFDFCAFFHPFLFFPLFFLIFILLFIFHLFLHYFPLSLPLFLSFSLFPFFLFFLLFLFIFIFSFFLFFFSFSFLFFLFPLFWGGYGLTKETPFGQNRLA